SSKVSRELRLDALTERLPGGEHLVLWAQSKEDGSYHAFGRVTAGGREVIALDDLAWKKIMSAQALVLSRESAANPLQPSAERVARGLCVKLNYDPVKA
ncbi:MAG: hypothetical protein LPK85_05405, partial [Gammaproteobacteria bacterium]|nr:hypothetical protein [Gammaproteobacteria bacterium]